MATVRGTAGTDGRRMAGGPCAQPWHWPQAPGPGHRPWGVSEIGRADFDGPTRREPCAIVPRNPAKAVLKDVLSALRTARRTVVVAAKPPSVPIQPSSWV